MRGRVTFVTRPPMAQTVSCASLSDAFRAPALHAFDAQPSETRWVRRSLLSALPEYYQDRSQNSSVDPILIVGSRKALTASGSSAPSQYDIPSRGKSKELFRAPSGLRVHGERNEAVSGKVAKSYRGRVYLFANVRMLTHGGSGAWKSWFDGKEGAFAD